MRIAWFTPFAVGSAIGRVSHCVVRELERLCEVELCHFGAPETLKTGVSERIFRSAADITPETIANYDVLVYNLGNHLPYHREIYLLSRRFPGIVILHDFVMHHFFAAYFLEQPRDPSGYILLLSRHYGETGAALAQDIVAGRRGGVWDTDEVALYPAFEETVRGALGVVTHSGFFRDKVAEVFAGPVKRIPLAYDCDQAVAPGTRAGLGVAADTVLIVTIGHVNPNKKVDSIIEALSRLKDLQIPFLYAVVGPCSPEYLRQLQSLAESVKLRDAVRFCGPVSDELLRAWLHHADFCVNLRFPAIEGASASAIEEMLFGKPVIVNNIGFFAELSDSSVVKVEPGNRSELIDALRRLITQPGLRQQQGIAAREYALAEHRSEHYAKEILEFAAEVRSDRTVLQLCDQVASELRDMGVPGDAPVVEKISQVLAQLFVQALS